MAAQRPRVSRVVIDNTGVRKLLKNLITEDVLDVAKLLLPGIADIYKDENGNKYQWNIKYSLDKRQKRMYGVIYCMNPAPKYKEARYGLIAKHLKSISTKTRINVQYQGGGIIIG